jgi:uncharacterized membrane protein
MKSIEARELFKPERLLAFSDGIFGVAVTLLVIDLRLPPIAEGDGDLSLLRAIYAIGPKVVVFAFTFIILGMSWFGHHRKFSYIDKVDSSVLWINLLYLMSLCLVPFASSVLSEHGNNRFAFVLYAAVMIIVEALSAVLSSHCLRSPYLAQPDMPPRMRQDMVLSPLLTAAVFFLAGAIALGNFIRAAHWTLLLIVPVMAFFGSHAGRFRPTDHHSAR